MVEQVDVGAGSLVLDVAAGTGAITRLLEARGFRVVAPIPHSTPSPSATCFGMSPTSRDAFAS
jgi:hypothetical protein